MPSVETRQHTLRIPSLNEMYRDSEEKGVFWREDARKNLPSLRSLHWCEEETSCLPRGELSFYCKCRIALKHLLQELSRKALYQVFVRGYVRCDLIDELRLTKQGTLSIWPWEHRLECFNDDEESLTWLVISRATWFGKRFCSARLKKSPNYIRCDGKVVNLDHAFFHC